MNENKELKIRLRGHHEPKEIAIKRYDKITKIAVKKKIHFADVVRKAVDIVDLSHFKND